MLNTIKQTVCPLLISALFVAIPFSSSRAQTGNDLSGVEPNKVLVNARTVYVWSQTAFVKQEVIESALLKRDDFRKSGLVLTKDGRGADVILTVRRASFTTEYPYDVVDRRTGLVLAGGRVNSLFGTAAGKIAKGFMKQVERARAEVKGKD